MRGEQAGERVGAGGFGSVNRADVRAVGVTWSRLARRRRTCCLPSVEQHRRNGSPQLPRSSSVPIPAIKTHQSSTTRASRRPVPAPPRSASQSTQPSTRSSPQPGPATPSRSPPLLLHTSCGHRYSFRLQRYGIRLLSVLPSSVGRVDQLGGRLVAAQRTRSAPVSSSTYDLSSK